jgi:MerR family mercuric resistance operon transcriptional regulator
MAAYTISKLASEAGVSIHIVRNYVLRGLLHPARRTEGGYNRFDDHALDRLHFVRAVFEAGVGLDELTHLCHALDEGNGNAVAILDRLRSWIATRREALAVLDQLLMKTAFTAVTMASK